MDLIYELLISYLKGEKNKKAFTKEIYFEQIIEKECYKVLNKVKAIIQDENLEDAECFDKIEQIICLFESCGIDSGTRHDF